MQEHQVHQPGGLNRRATSCQPVEIEGAGPVVDRGVAIWVPPPQVGGQHVPGKILQVRSTDVKYSTITLNFSIMC